ncbi:thermonuclease family protein [Roseovarius sp. EL26]|uniref:thermonuclease family protein n=1 Tax=Roseovarius sp. EL26 TaxID=2126672 RepID=UPI000EA33144|nr:thermonuclease family protein [Roseovarius sp. EL26]
MLRRARFAPSYRRRPWRYSRRNRFLDPRFYLKTIVVLGVMGMFVLPFLADAYVAVAKPAHDSRCRVLSVTDGDTVKVYCPGYGFESARLVGLDTPEIFSPKCFSEWARGTVASWKLRQMLWTADALSIERRGTDRYRRVLVQLSMDGERIADLMVNSGVARAYDGSKRQGWCDGWLV